MDFTQIGELVLAGIIGVMGYFLKLVHSDVRQNTKDVGENKGSISNLNTRIEHEAEMRNTAYNNIMSILTEIKDQIKTLKNDK